MTSDRPPSTIGVSRCSIGRFCSAGILLALATTLGCGGPETNRVELVRVSGTVTLDDQPLEKAIVIFEAPDASFSYGQTDSRGRYDLRFDSRTPGATPGPKTVRISVNRRIYGLNSNDEGGPDDQAGGSFEEQPPERVPERYNAQSTLTANVSRAADTFDFDLKSQPDDAPHGE
jgi:hypothetical protein